MAGLSKKEQRELLDSLAEQGARLIERDKGTLVRFPDGSTTMIHKSDSDWRASLNTRAEVRRAGFRWPWDAHEPRSAKSKGGGTRRTAPHAATLQRIERAIGALKIANNGQDGFTISDVARQAKYPETNRATIARALAHLGYSPVTSAPGALWFKPVEADYPVASAVLREQGKDDSILRDKPVKSPPITGAGTDGSTWPPRPLPPQGVIPKIVQPDPIPTVSEPVVSVPDPIPTVTPAVPTEAPKVSSEREFIDSVESWTLDLNDPLVQAKSIGVILSETKPYGLKVEVRVWR